MSSVNNKKYNPISASFFYTVGNMLIKAIPFLTLPIFTRLLTTEDFGLYNTYLSYETILTIVLGFGFVSTIRMAKVYFKEDFEKYVSSIFGMQIILGLLLDVFVFLVLAFVIPNFWMSKLVIVILLINCLCTQIYNIGTAKFAINGEMIPNLIASLALTFVNVGTSIILCIFVFRNNDAYLGRIIGTCIGSLVVAIVIFVMQLRRSHHLINKAFWHFGIRMGAPLIVHSLSLVVLSQSDKIMIQSLVGSSEAGIYSLAVTLVGIITVIVSSVDNAWAPWFYDNLEKKNFDGVYKFNNMMIAAFSILTIIIMLISPELIKIISEKSYWASTLSFPPLIVSVLFSFFYLIPVNFEYYHKKTFFIALSTSLTAVTNILLNLVFIKSFGYIGTAYATCLSNIMLFCMHWFRARSIEKTKIVSISWIIGLSITNVVTMVLVVFLESFILIRYLILFCVIIACVFLIKQTHAIKYAKTFFKKAEKEEK